MCRTVAASASVAYMKMSLSKIKTLAGIDGNNSVLCIDTLSQYLNLRAKSVRVPLQNSLHS